MTGKQENIPPLYSIPLTTIEGEEITLQQFFPSVLLLVNVASRCGFTGQYAGLQQLYDDYKEKGFVVLGFPCNDFLWQEPKTEAEIKEFCSVNYNVTFPLFSKLHVRGREQHPLYKYLCSEETNPRFAHRITWNFNKFLIGRKGEVCGYFGSMTKPEDKALRESVEEALRQKI